MKEMFRVILLILAAAASFGQTPPVTPEKAPPANPQAPLAVEAALRARITEFYQLEAEEKYNRALQMVAEDTKDAYVGSSKSTIRTFEIQSIQYSDNFTKADVMALVSRMLPIEGFMGRSIPMKTPSSWKIENGQWCYYEDPQKAPSASPFRRNPAGKVAVPAGGPPPAIVPGSLPAPALPGGLPAALPRTMPSSVPPSMPPSVPGAATGAVPGVLPGGPPGAARPLPAMPKNLPNPRALTVDKLSVELKSSVPSTAQVTISNPTPWPVTLVFSDPGIQGLTLKLDPLTLTPSTKAILNIGWRGGAELPKSPLTLRVTVRQTAQIIPIKISFSN